MYFQWPFSVNRFKVTFRIGNNHTVYGTFRMSQILSEPGKVDCSPRSPRKDFNLMSKIVLLFAKNPSQRIS